MNTRELQDIAQNENGPDKDCQGRSIPQGQSDQAARRSKMAELE